MKETTRRGALLVGAAGVAGGLTRLSGRRSGTADRTVARLQTVATAVLPPDAGHRAVAETTISRLSPDRFDRLRSLCRRLDRRARVETGRPLSSLSGSDCRDLLAHLGVFRVQSRADGTLVERYRHHLTNALMYTYLVTPAGTAPLGIDNPVGYPGGFESYRRFADEWDETEVRADDE
ncbi:hypothetical protein RYH80_06885 [Halobaculum sp. MBLA0147]|uniref:hypothetical protein n=1 Tax=Halobaculum sp. MBLA0147 TaxID=3079934 RepID=UPI0035242632